MFFGVKYVSVCMNSRYPTSYSSFYVVFFDENPEKVLDPALWPSGCMIAKFIGIYKTQSELELGDANNKKR